MGNFIRVLLPVQLTDDYQIVIGCWLGVPADQFDLAGRVWNTPAYDELVLEGLMANAVAPWPSVLGAPAIAKPRSSNELPYVVESGDPGLAQVLRDIWPHADAVKAWPKLLEGL
jgi:hypothetical protein